MTRKAWRLLQSGWLMRKPARGLRASKFDDYLSLQLNNDRDVALRYHFFDPLVVLAGFSSGNFPIANRLTSYGNSDIYSYSQSLIEKGQDLEAKGALSSATSLY